SHPDYQLLLETYQGTEDASSHRAAWPQTIGEHGDRNPMHGVESYLVPGIVWTRKYVSTALPSVTRLGTIEQPPGNPPELSNGRTWLKIRVRATWRGNIWQIEET